MPDVIQAALMGTVVRLTDGVGAVRAAIGDELFLAGIAIQAGRPDFLTMWRAGETSDVWTTALEQAATNPRDPLFDRAFARAFFERSYNREDFMPTLIAAAHVDADAVFNHLIERSISDGGLRHAAHWQVLLEIGPPSGDRSTWFDRMADVAHEVVDSFVRLDVWITDNAHRAELERRLGTDHVILLMLVGLANLLQTERRLLADERDDPALAEEFGEGINAGEIGGTVVQAIICLMQARAPRFLDTIDTVDRILSAEDLLSEEGAEALAAIREGMLEFTTVAGQAYREADRALEPEDWVKRPD